MLIYGDLVKEAMNMMFYASPIPTDTARSKISMNNIGRTMTDRYPVLSVSDRAQPWSHFNVNLSIRIPEMNAIKFSTSWRNLCHLVW